MLRGTEYEGQRLYLESYILLICFPVARQDLVVWLQDKIAEQKRIDANTSGAERLLIEHSAPLAVPSSKDNVNARDVQLILPGDLKKGKGGPKQIFYDRGWMFLLALLLMLTLFSGSVCNVDTSKACCTIRASDTCYGRQ